MSHKIISLDAIRFHTKKTTIKHRKRTKHVFLSFAGVIERMSDHLTMCTYRYTQLLSIKLLFHSCISCNHMQRPFIRITREFLPSHFYANPQIHFQRISLSMNCVWEREEPRLQMRLYTYRCPPLFALYVYMEIRRKLITH